MIKGYKMRYLVRKNFKKRFLNFRLLFVPRKFIKRTLLDIENQFYEDWLVEVNKSRQENIH